MRRMFTFIVSLSAIIGLACNFITVNINTTKILEMGQGEPQGISCQNNSWTLSPDNGLRVDFTQHDGFVYELNGDQLTVSIYRNDQNIDQKSMTVTDGIVKVTGTLPDMPYNNDTVDIRFTMYLLVCGGKLYWTDFTVPPSIPSQNG